MSLRVLAVDDDSTTCDIRTALEPKGFVVHTADDGADAIDLLNDVSPDVIFAGINLPRMDGIGFIDAVRKSRGHGKTPILVMMTGTEPELKLRAREAGATGWIAKPLEPAKLIQALHMVAG
ncbi:MAG: response regulator [Pseudomonadota bacterium]